MTHRPTPRTATPQFPLLAMLGVLAFAGCDNAQSGAPGSPAQPTSNVPSTGGGSGSTQPTDATAAVPMDDAAGAPATTWPAGGAPADGTPPADAPAPSDGTPAADAPAPADAAGATPPPADAPAPAPAATGQRQSVGGLSFELPEGWTLKPASTMRLGTVTDGTVEIALSSFPGDVGGKLANVNRWRGQVGLPPVAEADLERETRTIEVDGKPVMLVDAAGTETRLLAASIPGDGKLFFARLMGPTDQVGARKDAFEALVKSIKVE
jgi:hypothetical protein